MRPVPEREAAAAELRRAADEMEKAAMLEGVEPESALGVFVRAQKHALTKQADLIEEFEKSLFARVDQAHAAAAVELETLRVGLRQAIELQEQAKQAVLVIQARREAVATQALKDNWPEMIKALKPWLVWQETRFNYAEKWRTALVSSVFILMVGGGAYGLRALQDGPATAALNNCLSAGLKANGDGRRICYVDQLVLIETSSTGWPAWISKFRQTKS